MVFPIASYTFLWRVLQEPPIQNHQQITQKASKKKNQKTNPVLLSLSMKKGVPENRKLSNTHTIQWRVPGGSDKESTCNVGHLGLIPEWGRSPGEGNGNPLQPFLA